MQKKIELLAPGGDLESIKAAVLAGADAVYCGLDRFNARNRAENITLADLNGIIRLAHSHACEVFLTLNIIIIESELPAFIRLLNKLVKTNLDAVIVQDLGALYLLATYFPTLNIHASTQLTTHNEGQIAFLNKLTASRVNLCRELSITDIKALTKTAHAHKILTEVFVHGSYCLSFSGLCGFSSVQSGNSGNRGRCSQPCRNQYQTTAAGSDFPLNLKDNSAYSALADLAEAGVDSLKIEGRIKKFHYVHTVVRVWRQHLDKFFNGEPLAAAHKDLYRVFNRGFSDGFLLGNINQGMFIDNPRDYSAIHLAKLMGGVTVENIKKAKRELYDLKTDIITKVRGDIEPLSIEKAPVDMIISGQCGTTLKVLIKTPGGEFSSQSKVTLSFVSTRDNAACLNQELILERFKAINDTEYFIANVDLANLGEGLFLPFKELTALKKGILFALNGGRQTVKPIAVPVLKNHDCGAKKTTLSVLISSRQDLHLAAANSSNVYFQLPNSLANNCTDLIDMFRENKNILPWFPAVLMVENYQAALDFLLALRPKRIITNNTGIAYAAYRAAIPWIAGPALNTVNSFSLLCLKEKFNCYGAFISNEINRQQIKSLKRPEGLNIFASIYHPLALITSRQCLFQQVGGCHKVAMDADCLADCQRSAVLTDLNNSSLYIQKTKGSYHCLYNDINFLNTDIVSDIPDLFAGFLIDLRDIKTATKVKVDKAAMLQLFTDLLAGNPGAGVALRRCIHPTVHRQYEKGL